MIVWSLCCGFLLVGRGPQLSLLSSPKMSFLSGKVPPVLPHVRGAWLPVGYLGEYCRMHWPSFSFVAGQRLHLYYRHKPTVVEADRWWLWGSLPLTVDAVEGMLRDTVLLPVAEHVFPWVVLHGKVAGLEPCTFLPSHWTLILKQP